VTASCIETDGHSGTSLGIWQQLADDVLAGETISREQALAVLESPDDELLDLLSAVYRIRRRSFSNQVQLYFLMNAKSGLCPEDCSYCSQSKVSEAEIPRYNLLSRDKLLEGARLAAERKARTYCIVISARGPNEREMAAVTTIVPQIKQQYNLKICACPACYARSAQELKTGRRSHKHNLNTSDSDYGEIFHTFIRRSTRHTAG
jgi:biotin synthase